MRWFWFATFTLACGLFSIFLRQPLILLGELLLVELFITRKLKWFGRGTPNRLKVPFWLNLMLWIFVTTWIIRLLAIDSIRVQGSGTKPAIQPGDHLIVSKIHFGPRLPFSSIQLSGIARIRRNELIAYHFPEGDSVPLTDPEFSYYALKRKRIVDRDTQAAIQARYRKIYQRTPEVSRIIGLPGDTLAMSTRPGSDPWVANDIIVGSTSQSTVHHPADRQKGIQTAYNFLIELKDPTIQPAFFQHLFLHPSELQFVKGLGYIIPLRYDQLMEVRRRPEVHEANPYVMEPERGDYNIFPHDARFPWNRDNFGPVIVPKSGDRIVVTSQNISIYQRIIEVYENNRVELRKDSIIINGLPAGHYTFKQDYYFVAGDNRHQSRDSRHWGFLPADHVIGKPVLIWFSAGKTYGEDFRIFWNRIFKKI